VPYQADFKKEDPILQTPYSSWTASIFSFF